MSDLQPNTVLFALIAAVAASRLLGSLFRRLRQPPVIGEMVAGFLLGPSAFGFIAPRRGGLPVSPGADPLSRNYRAFLGNSVHVPRRA
jgi:hypothetical protein